MVLSMKKFHSLIDLTHALHPNIPSWSGVNEFSTEVTLNYDDCDSDVKFKAMKFHFAAGLGTHIDAPAHCVPGGLTVDQFTVADLYMPCNVIDVSATAHERYSVSVADIVSFEEMHGAIQSGSCVMIRTGWDRFWSEPQKYRNNLVFPSVSVASAELLLQRGVRALGIDTLSPDRPEDGFLVHQAFLASGRIIIENVANLAQIPVQGAYVLIAPLKAQGATEAPTRVVCIL